MKAAELLAIERAMTPSPWRAGLVDVDCLFFPDPNGLAGPAGESVLLRMNKHFWRFKADNKGIEVQRNHAIALAGLVRACELWADLGQLPPSIAAALAAVHAIGADHG